VIEKVPLRPAAGQRSEPLRIGEVLIKSGLITREEAGEAARHSVEQNVRFGEAAVALGFVAAQDIEIVVSATLMRPLVAEHTNLAPSLVSFHGPGTPKAEDVRNLRNSLFLRWFSNAEGGRALSIISPHRGDGRSLTAANLAISFAQAGARTLLIDADLRHPSQHLLFGLNTELGLAEFLAGRAGRAAHYSLSGLETLTVIPVGKLPSNPQELLLRPNFGLLLTQAAIHFEVIIIDTPAGADASDFQVSAAATRGALFVGRIGATRMRDAKRMLKSCEELSVSVVGSVSL
jgi:receptor protein-tyrosine kinase